MAENPQSVHDHLVGRAAPATAIEGARDEELARLLKARSAAAWEFLFERDFDRIYRYALGRVSSIDAAEDIASTTFNRALATIDRYSYRSRPIIAWLYGIAANVVKETLRAEARERRKAYVRGMFEHRDGHQLHTSLHIVGLDTATNLATRIDLDRAMRRLSKLQREVVLLRYFAGLSAFETGQVIHRRDTAVYALQARALDNLRRQLG